MNFKEENTKRPQNIHIIVRLMKLNDKEKIFKVTREK